MIQIVCVVMILKPLNSERRQKHELLLGDSFCQSETKWGPERFFAESAHKGVN